MITSKHEPQKPLCPKCGAELEDAGNYKWDCPNDCYQVSLELWQMEDRDWNRPYNK